MSLTFSFDWENGEGIRGREYAATYASLSIRTTDGRYPTRVLDKASKSVRTEIRLPLFPIARWLIENWWFLFCEPSSPSKRSTKAKDAQFRARHSLRNAGDGYALPELVFEPTGAWVRISWRAYKHEFASIEFQDSGKVDVPKADLEGEVRRFVDRILARMDEQESSDLDLVRDWTAIGSVDREQLEFCAAVASMGKDPFSLSPRVQHSLMLEWGHAREASIPDQTFWEICAVSSFGELRSTVDWVHGQVQNLSPSRLTNLVLKTGPRLRRMSAGNGSKQTPWNRGYQWAQRVRADLLNDLDNADVGRFLVDQVDIFSSNQNEPAFKALVGPTKRDSLGLAILQGRDESQRFGASRALYVALASYDMERSVSVATSSETDLQQASRAFGAELLAPSSDIKRLLRNRWLVGPDEVDELAAVFHVSPILIQHQIANHQLAELETGSISTFTS